MRVLIVAVTACCCAAGVPAHAQGGEAAGAELVPVLTNVDHKLRLTIGGATRTIQYGISGEDDALVQGDIILGKGFDIEAYRSGQSALGLPNLFGLFRIGDGFLWPQGRVRYMYAPDFRRHDIVRAAIAHWQEKTRIRFEQIAAPSGNYVLFEPSKTGCAAHAGMQGGGQSVKLGDDCLFGNAVHEIGHALGLGHEHMRADRNKYVVYLAQNVEPGMGFNFAIDEWNYEDVKAYCYGSIMHYSETAFGITVNGQVRKTLVPKRSATIGQRDGLNPCDIEAVEQMYARELAKRDGGSQR